MNATREIRCLTYKISTVVSNGDYHQELEPSTVNNIEVIENMMMYCRINAKYGFSPLRVKINYPGQLHPNVKIYLSLTNKMPSADNCDKEYTKPKFIKIWAPDREKRFANSFIYFAIWAPLGASLEITPRFTSEEVALGKKRKNKEADILEKKDIMMLNEREIIEKQNKSASVESKTKKIRIPPEINSSVILERKRAQNMLILNQKQEQAKERKKRLDIQFRNDKIKFLKRWDLFRRQRKEQTRINNEIIKRRIFKKFWQKLYLTRNGLKGLFHEFSTQKENKRIAQEKKIMARRIQLNYKWAIQNYGGNVDERNLNKIKYAFTYFSNLLETTTQSKIMPRVNRAILEDDLGAVSESKLLTPEAILLGFLKNSGNKKAKFSKFVLFWQNSNKISQFFKMKLKQREERKKFLCLIWDTKIKEATKNMSLSKAKAKKASKPMKKILSQLKSTKNILTDETQKKIVELYYKYCEIRYKIRFLKYQSLTGRGEDFTLDNIETFKIETHAGI